MVILSLKVVFKGAVFKPNTYPLDLLREDNIVIYGFIVFFQRAFYDGYSWKATLLPKYKKLVYRVGPAALTSEEPL